jgi:hypothetical protein
MVDRNARIPYIMEREERKLGTKQERKEFLDLFYYSRRATRFLTHCIA